MYHACVHNSSNLDSKAMVINTQTQLEIVDSNLFTLIPRLCLIYMFLYQNNLAVATWL